MRTVPVAEAGILCCLREWRVGLGGGTSRRHAGRGGGRVRCLARPLRQPVPLEEPSGFLEGFVGLLVAAQTPECPAVQERDVAGGVVAEDVLPCTDLLELADRLLGLAVEVVPARGRRRARAGRDGRL